MATDGSFSHPEANVPLGPLTTLAVGGAARWMVCVPHVSGLRAALAWAQARGIPTLILGDGSNMLVGDAGFEGLVIRLAFERAVFIPEGRVLRVWADAGVSWDRLVDEAVFRNAAGIECLTGIPGRVGAAPIQNIGAYGQELADTVVAVQAVERATGRLVIFDRDECGFGYRASRFKRSIDQWVVVGVQLALRAGGSPTLKYADLEARATEGGRTPSLASVRALVRSIRSEKSMLRTPGDANYHSAGSFFTNPIVEVADAARVTAVAEARGQGRPPQFDAGEGRVKLSAAWLIERAGFARGWGHGPAGLSTRHTLALVNRGGATANDILVAARAIRDGVQATFEVRLVPEPVFISAAL